MGRRVALLLALGACSGGEESLVLSATPLAMPADGVSLVELRADVTFRDDPLADGKPVIFRADAALLFESREDAAAGVTRPPGSTEVDPRSRGGAAIAYLLAPTEAASVGVVANFTTVNKDVLTDSVVVELTAPPLVAAGAINGTDLASVERYFQFDCDQPAIGAFATPRPELRVPCSVLVLKDPAGRDLPHTPVRFIVEAGRIDDVPADHDDPRSVTYVVPNSPTRWPADVRPFDGEGWVRLGSSLIPGAVEQNPRDGLVTLLAVVRGAEALDDNNGNGVWDAGEFFIDEGEPFLDVDDDGVFTEGTDEGCCDSNGNGSVDGPNGRWDSDVWIGRDTRILWTGPVDTTSGRSGIEPASWNIPAQSGKDFLLRVVDGNGNPPAALATADRIDETLLPSMRIRYSTPPDFAIYRGPGFGRGEAYPFRIFGEVERAVGPVQNEDVRQFSFRLEDGRTSTVCIETPWSLAIEVLYTLGRDYSSADFTTQTELLSASGNLEALNPCPP